MRSRFALALAAGCLIALMGDRLLAVALVEKGQAKAVIVAEQQKIRGVKAAAHELQTYVKKITGVALPIQTQAEAGKAVLAVGPGKHAAGMGVDTSKFSRNEFIIRVRGNVGVVAGFENPKSRLRPLGVRSRSGTIFGAFYVIREIWGVNFVQQGEDWEVYSKRDTLAIPQMDLRKKPFLRYAYLGGGCGNRTDRWQRANGIGTKLMGFTGHAFNWITTKKNWREHRDWFATYKGKPSHIHPCYLHPEVLKMIIARAKRQAAGRPDVVDLSPNDGSRMCDATCPRCGKYIDPKDPSRTNVLVEFWNRVAKGVGPLPRGTSFTSYCYSAYAHPPTRIRPNPDFIPYTTICGGTTALFQGLAENRAAGLRGWSENGTRPIFMRTHLWAVNNTPTYGPRGVYRFWKGLIKLGVKGVSAEAYPDWGTFGINFYVTARVLNDPSVSVGKIMDDYFAVFGAAAKPMREYYEAVEARWVNAEKRSPAKVFTPDFIGKCKKILDRARAAAGTPREKRCVEFIAFGLRFTELYLKRHAFYLKIEQQGFATQYRDMYRVRMAPKVNPKAFQKTLHEAVAVGDKLEAVLAEHKTDPKPVDTKLFLSYTERKSNFPHKQLKELLTLMEGKEIAVAPNFFYKFRVDEKNVGRKEKWFAPEFDDSAWGRISVCRQWEYQGYGRANYPKSKGGYDGRAWYRQRFVMPPEFKGKKICLYFGSIDDGAWVFLNGKYLGENVTEPFKAPRAWKIPFVLDAKDAIKFGQENVLAVEVNDKAGLGGIWRPIFVLAE